MKIIQVYQTNPFIEGQGGGVRYVRNLLSGIKKDCSEILFLGIGKNEKNEDNILLKPITKEMTGYIKFLFMMMLKLPFINLSKYDVVHVHRLYFAIPFILLKPKLKIVCSLHGRTFSVFESNNGSLKLKIIKPLFLLIEKFSIRHIDYLVPVSQDVINSFKSKYSNFENHKIEIIGSMLNLNNFKIMDSKTLQLKFGYENKYVLFIGRLADVKDIDFLINLWSKKFDRSPDIKLVIAGDGELKEELHGLVNNICVNNQPILLGEIEPSNISSLISSSSMTILSSKHEASPTVVKESLSCGIPVITNNIGDVKEFIINDKNGYIVEKNFENYFEAILGILKKNITKNNVLLYSKDNLKKCSIEYVSNRYMEIFKKVIQ